MSKKIFDTTAFVNDLIKKGWKFEGDILIPPDKSVKPIKPSKKQKRTYDEHDHINIKNRDIFSPFKSFIKNHIDIDLWSEFHFCKERKFRIDFADPVNKIAIEIDGGIWMKGKSGHSSGTGIKRDQEKTTLLSQYGWRVLRFEPSEQLTIKTANIILETIKNKTAGK